MHKNTPYIWTDEQQTAFNELKRCLTAAPVLLVANPNQPFTVTTDASDYAIGAVLSQNQGRGDQPIAYESRKLSPHELNYAIHEKELLAIVHALRTWRTYLEGRHFTVITDHASLEYIKTQHNISRRQARWLETLQAHDFEVKYRPGKTNVVADALSRAPRLSAISIASTHLIDNAILREAYTKDAYFNDIFNVLSKPEDATDKQRAKAKHFELAEQRLYLKEGQRLCVPKDKTLRTTILQEAHDSQTAGHFSIDKTYENVTKDFYWPKMSNDIKRYVSTCDSCQRNKASNQQTAGLLQTLDTPTRRWEQITMDFITHLPVTKNGNDSIVVFVDRLSKRAHFRALHSTATAPEIAKLFFTTIFVNHGLLTTIISDRDAKFTSRFWKALFKLTDTRLAMSTAYHPQTDGQTERLNRTLEEMLRAYVGYKQDNWDEYLTMAEFAYNNAKQMSSGFTPFELDCGQPPITPLRLAMMGNVVKPDEIENVPAANEFIRQWSNKIAMAKDALQDAQRRQTEYTNRHRRRLEFKIGDKVLLSTKNIDAPADRRRPTKKLTPRRFGPFNIIEKMSPLVYKLDLPASMKTHPVFHISLLKKYNEDTEDFERPIPPPPVEDIDTNEEYEVEDILDKRIIKRKTQYLVKWKGYSLHDATWEPVEHLGNAEDVILHFESMEH